VLNEQPPAELDGAKFYGMDRDAETVSEHVEGTISKSGVSPADALAILNLLLQNETGYLVYEYYFCDVAGEVELLGLAQDILELIPFDGEAFHNGPTGDMPKGFWDWLVSIFVTIVTFIVGVIVAVVGFIVQLFKVLIDWGIKLLGWLWQNVVLNAIKLVILVYVFIMLAIAIFFSIIAFLLLISFVIIGVLIVNFPITLTYGFLWCEITYPSKTTRFQITIVDKYSSFIDLSFPCLEIQFQNEFYPINFIFTFGIPIDYETNNLLVISQESKGNLQIYGENPLVDNEGYNIGRIGALFIGAGVTLGIAFAPTNPLIGLIIVIFITLAVEWGLFSIQNREALAIGLGLGLIHSGLIMLAPLVSGYIADFPTAFATRYTYLWLKNGDPTLQFSGYGPEYEDNAIIDSMFNTLLVALCVMLYNLYVEKQNNRKYIWWIAGVLFIVIGFVICEFTHF